MSLPGPPQKWETLGGALVKNQEKPYFIGKKSQPVGHAAFGAEAFRHKGGGMASALDVANYFLAASDAEDGLTNLKIQKLCAYAQAISLAYLEKPLFEEDIQAWKHGPVIPSVYESFKKYGRESIECSGLSTEYARCPFSDEQKLVLELVNEFYGQFSASALRRMSHDDFMGQPFGSMAAISQRSLVDMFKSNLIVERLNAKQDSCRFDPQSNRVISEEEFWDAL